MRMSASMINDHSVRQRAGRQPIHAARVMRGDLLPLGIRMRQMSSSQTQSRDPAPMASTTRSAGMLRAAALWVRGRICTPTHRPLGRPACRPFHRQAPAPARSDPPLPWELIGARHFLGALHLIKTGAGPREEVGVPLGDSALHVQPPECPTARSLRTQSMVRRCRLKVIICRQAAFR
jgi:hypothetical protein